MATSSSAASNIIAEAPADHRIDVTEFGWYLADCALSLGGDEKAEVVMAEVVQKFDPDAA